MGHVKQIFAVVFHGKGLVLKGIALEDALSPRPVAVCIISALYNEIGNHPVNARSFVAHVFSGNGSLALVALAEGRKILNRLGGDFSEQAKNDFTNGVATDGNFQKDSFRDEGQCSGDAKVKFFIREKAKPFI